MGAVRVRVIVPLLAAASLLASGCASPPEAEKKAADDAVSAARTAGAARYAAAEFAAMTAALRKAEFEMSTKAHKEAKASYGTLKELADKAAKAAESSKAAMKAEAEKQLGDADTRWQDLQAKAQAAAKRLTAEQRKLWEANGRSVTDGLKAARDALATDAAAAREKLSAVAATLGKWEEDLAAMAMPGKKPQAKTK